jgi:hypothetical protein
VFVCFCVGMFLYVCFCVFCFLCVCMCVCVCVCVCVNSVASRDRQKIGFVQPSTENTVSASVLVCQYSQEEGLRLAPEGDLRFFTRQSSLGDLRGVHLFCDWSAVHMVSV